MEIKAKKLQRRNASLWVKRTDKDDFIQVQRIGPKQTESYKSELRRDCATYSVTDYGVNCTGGYDTYFEVYSHTQTYTACTSNEEKFKVIDEIGGGGAWGGGGDGGSAEDVPTPIEQPNPCAEAKEASENATTLSKTAKFNTKLNEIREAYNQIGGEHVVAFGKDASGNVIASDVAKGGGNSGRVPAIQNRFADLHNHPTNIPPSSGDVYGFIDLATNNPDYQRFITLPNGTVYALFITNLQQAKDFNQNYPRVPPPVGTTFEPNFPKIIVDEINEMEQIYNASKEISISYILQKYNCGIALLKENSDGEFKRQNVKEGPLNHYGLKTFQKKIANKKLLK